jgi:hypothetical protein
MRHKNAEHFVFDRNRKLFTVGGCHQVIAEFDGKKGVI